MKKKTLLVCGSSGFLMSTFIRYLLYRSKDHRVISVDNLADFERSKRLYIHRDHRFYMGNVSDEDFIYKLVQLEKPDVIINGVKPPDPVHHAKDGPETIVRGALNLAKTEIPMIQLTPHIWEMDPFGWWNSAAQTVNNYNGIVLELPNCFGFRQKPTGGVSRIISNIIKYKEVTLNPDPVPFAYSEDVASLIWFLIEQKISDKKFKHIKMPISGILSEVDIASEIIKQLKLKDVKKIIDKRLLLCKTFEGDHIDGWVSDYKDIQETLNKTIQWYISNTWALNI